MRSLRWILFFVIISCKTHMDTSGLKLGESNPETSLDVIPNKPVVGPGCCQINQTYYIDSQIGNDSNSGLAVNLAWKSVSKVNSFHFQPGDQILFKRSQIWRAEHLLVKYSGTNMKPIVYGAYGSGSDPILNDHPLITNGWTHNGGGIYQSALTPTAHSIFSNKKALKKGSDEFSLNPQEWFYNTSSKKIFVRLDNDVNPILMTMQYDSHNLSNYGIYLYQVDYVKIENIELHLFGTSSTGTGIWISESTHITINNCKIIGDEDPGDNGIRIRNSPQHLIAGNDISGFIYGIHIYMYDGNSPGIVEYNFIHDLDKGNPDPSLLESDGIKINYPVDPSNPTNPASGDGDGSNLIIRHNEITHFQEDGIDFYCAKNIIIENNYIHDSYNVVVGDTFASGNNQSGIKTIAPGAIIRNNRVLRLDSPGLHRQGIIAHREGIEVYGNVIDDIGEYPLVLKSGADYTGDIFNNLDETNQVVSPIYSTPSKRCL